MIEITLDELKKYNGKNGERAYVAYQGIIYDMTDNPMWDDGEHEAMHDAGLDLTAAHDDAPHDAYVTDFPQAGRLI